MLRALFTLATAVCMADRLSADDGLSADERQLIERVNAERAKADLPPLKTNARLMTAARDHSANMARKKELAHDLDGKGPGERLEGVGYSHSGCGENCAAGQRTPAEAMACWLDSPGHRANLLGKSYREIGVGIARSADGTVYWTQVFAIPGR